MTTFVTCERRRLSSNKDGVLKRLPSCGGHAPPLQSSGSILLGRWSTWSGGGGGGGGDYGGGGGGGGSGYAAPGVVGAKSGLAKTGLGELRVLAPACHPAIGTCLSGIVIVSFT